MSLMDQVREIGTAEDQVSEETMRAARGALTHEIRREKASRTTRRRTWTGIGLGGLVAGTAVTAIVVGSVLAPPTAPSASAAEVLNAAAETTLTTAVLDPAPGQYIRIQEVSSQQLGWNVDQSSAAGGHWDSQASATTAIIRQARSLYVPSDRSGDWVEDYGESTELLKISGPDAATAEAALDQLEFNIRVDIYPSGRYHEPDAVDPEQTFHRNALECYYDEMPRDPDALVRWLDEYDHEYKSECAPPRIGDPVEFNLAPADLRATMFRALALVDGAHVVEVDGDVTTIAFPDGGDSNWMQTVDVDTSQGLIVGRGNLDDDRWSSRIHVTVVDRIPASVPLP